MTLVRVVHSVIVVTLKEVEGWLFRFKGKQNSEASLGVVVLFGVLTRTSEMNFF